MFFWVFVAIIVVLPVVWLWHSLPYHLLAHMEKRYDAVFFLDGTRGDVTDRLHVIGLRLEMRFIEIACRARTLAGKTLKRPSEFQNTVDQLMLRAVGPTTADELLELITGRLHNPSGAAGQAPEYRELEIIASDLVLNVRRLKRLRQRFL